MPDSNNPIEVLFRDLHHIIKFDYVCTDMKAIRKAVVKFADAEIAYRAAKALKEDHENR